LNSTDTRPHLGGEAGRIIVTVTHPGHGEVSMLGSALHIDGAPLPVRQPAPELGEYTDEIPGELGLTADQIAQLRDGGVV
jgi:formyl-CoA transferase